MPVGQLLDAGPAAIVWDPDGADETIFEHMLEDLIFKDEEQEVDIFEAQHGDTPVDSVTMGQITSLEANMTRETLLRLSKINIGSVISGAANDQLTFTNPVGDHKYQYAKKVQIKPIKDGVISTTSQEWIEIYKCIAKRAWEIPYGKGQRIYHMIFKVYPDQTSGNQGKTYQLGDAT
jgi:hypothetical protein